MWCSNNTSNLPILYAPSNHNHISLYAPSNAQSNWDWGSNTASWASNNAGGINSNLVLGKIGSNVSSSWYGLRYNSNTLSNTGFRCTPTGNVYAVAISGGGFYVDTQSNSLFYTTDAETRCYSAFNTDCNITSTGTITSSNVAINNKLYLGGSSNYGRFSEDWGWKFESGDTSHNFKIVSGSLIVGSNVQNTAITSKICLSSNNVMEFGLGWGSKGTNSGKIGYNVFTTGALDIVGAGADTTPATRAVKIWDNLTVADTIYAGTIGSSSTAYNVKFKNDGSGIIWGNSYSKIYDNGNLYFDTDDHMYFTINGTSKLYLKSTGAGINNITPDNPLTVNGSMVCYNLGMSGGVSYRYFYVQSDGNVIVYNQNNSALWSTNTSYSDARAKENVRDVESVLDKFDAVKPKRFNYKKNMGCPDTEQIGFMAQDIELVFPEVVRRVPKNKNEKPEGVVLADNTDFAPDEDFSYLIDYEKLTPILFKAIQELKAEVANLKASSNPLGHGGKSPSNI